MVVGGKVRVVMGLQKSPKHGGAPPKPPLPSPASGKSASSKAGAAFSRYFPRSSAQVQPRPPDIPELLRLVEELRDRESRLKTELLEHKLVKETAAIVPLLECEITSRNADIAGYARKVDDLEAENFRLREELAAVRCQLEEQRKQSEDKAKAMEAEIAHLKETAAAVAVIDRSSDELSTSQRFQASLTDITARYNLSKSLKKYGGRCITETAGAASEGSSRFDRIDSKTEEATLAVMDIDMPRFSRCDSEDIVERSRVPRVPNPPPKRSVSASTSPTASGGGSPEHSNFPIPETINISLPMVIAPPPPPPPPPMMKRKASPPPLPPPPPPRPQPAEPTSKAGPPPPPPPPPPPVSIKPVQTKVTRVPEVVEFYHSLMRRDSRRDSGAGVPADGPPATAHARDMIGEIENRSAHLLAVRAFFPLSFRLS